MRAVNLLPINDARAKRKKASPPVMVGSIGGVLVTGLMSFMFLGAHGDVAKRQDELRLVKDELALLPPIAAESATETSLRQQRDQRVTALAAALGKRVAWDRVLRQVSLVMPEDVWLTQLVAKSPTASAQAPNPAGAAPAPVPGAAPTTFTIQGGTYSQDGVARLLARLAVVPDLRNVQLEKSVRTKVGQREYVSFNILADVKPGTGATS